MKSLLLLCVCLSGASSPAWAEVVHTIDFSGQPDGPAAAWLRQRGFVFRLNAEKLAPRFENGRLVLQTESARAGLFELPVHLSGVEWLRVAWGVERYPHGADWSRGVTAVPVAVMTSFGTRKISSGSLFVPNAPYFIGLFLGEKERGDRVYRGNYYKKGGRYYCTPCGTPTGRRVVTVFDLATAFRSEFELEDIPPISRFGFQMNTKRTSGGAEAFIEKVEFLSD